MRVFRIIFSFTIFPLLLSAQQDSLLQLLQKHPAADSIRMNILFAIVENSNDDSEWPKYNEEAFSIARKLIESKDSAVHATGVRGMGDALNNKGYYEDHVGNINAAIQYYEKSIFYRQDANDKRGLAESYNNLGTLYGKQGDVFKAIDYNQQSLKFREEIDDKKGIAQSLNNLGYIYKDQGDLDKALEYFNRSLQLKESIHDEKGIANSYNNIGLLFMSENKYDTALFCFNKSLAIRIKIDHKWGIANSLNNIGFLHLKKNELDSSLACHQRALKIRQDIDDKEGISYSMRYLGETYFKMGQTALALNYAKESMDIAVKAGYVENMQFSSQLLYKIYKAQGNFKDALAMHELFTRMSDSLSNEKTKQASLRSQFKYEYEKKENDLKAAQQKEKEMTEKSAEHQKFILNIFIVGFAIMLVIAAIIYNSYKNKRKANLIIEKQKEILEEKQKEILDSILYAKRIQDSLLPSEKYIEKNLKRHLKNGNDAV